MAGPGYHRFVGRVLERLGAEVGIDWTDGDGASTFVDRPGRRALLPRLARPAARPGAGRAFAAASEPCRSGMPPRHPLHHRGGARDRPRSARRGLARGGHRRPARGPRHHAVVGRRDRRPIPAQPRPRADVARGPLAGAGDGGRGRSLRRGPSTAVARLPDGPGARRSLACLGGVDCAARHQRPDGAPGRRPRDDRARARPPVGYRRDPVEITHEGWALEIPGAYAERRTRRGVVGRRRGPKHHAGGDDDRPRRRHTDGGPRHSSTSSRSTSGPTRSPTGPARSWVAPG